MNDGQRKYRKRRIFYQIIWIGIFIILYGKSRSIMAETSIENSYTYLGCQVLMDSSIIAAVFQVVTFIVILCMDADEFYFRVKMRVAELLPIVGLVCFFVFHKNQCAWWIDVILFVIFLIITYARDNNYVNRLKVIEISECRDDEYGNYMILYKKISSDVEQFNSTEEKLLRSRIKYAKNDQEIKKANRDKRYAEIKEEYWMNLSDEFPLEPRPITYMGIWGIFNGGSIVTDYLFQVNQYTSKLKKTYMKAEKKYRRLVAEEENANNALRYIEGTADESKLEQILQVKTNKSEKVEKSYGLFNRGRFDRKKIKF